MNRSVRFPIQYCFVAAGSPLAVAAVLSHSFDTIQPIGLADIDTRAQATQQSASEHTNTKCIYTYNVALALSLSRHVTNPIYLHTQMNNNNHFQIERTAHNDKEPNNKWNVSAYGMAMHLVGTTFFRMNLYCELLPVARSEFSSQNAHTMRNNCSAHKFCESLFETNADSLSTAVSFLLSLVSSQCL